MNEDYESAKKLLEELQKKYSLNPSIIENIKKPSETSKKIVPKASKSSEPTSSKSLKPSSDTSTITVAIDNTIPEKYGSELSEKLRELEIRYEFSEQLFPGLITWSLPSREALLIIDWKEIVSLIESNDFLDRIKSIREVLSAKRLCLGLYGIEGYFEYLKAERGGKVSKKHSEYKGSVRVSRGDFETALTEVQLVSDCCYRVLNCPQDVVDSILQFTKAIVQLPEKLEKQEKYKDCGGYSLLDNRDCVAVDKNGNGLKRLWQQQLTSFEMARLETAEAIMSEYSNPKKLLKAYENCNEIEGKKLLEDIPVRRSAGRQASSRKVGKEFSSKVYKFFNSVDGDSIPTNPEN